MEVTTNSDGRVFTAAGLSSADVAKRLDPLLFAADASGDDDDYDSDLNQIVLERIHLDRSVMLKLKALLESNQYSWISLKLVDCHYSMMLTDPDSSEYLECAPSPNGIPYGNFLRYPPHLVLQATTTTIPNNQMTPNNTPFLPFGCIGRIKSFRFCTRCLTKDMSRRLCDAISKTNTLEEFSLSGSRRLGGGTGGSGLSPMLVDGLRKNNSIKVLDFGDCQLNNPQVISLLTAIKGHSNLRTLNLSNNKFSDEGLNALATVLLQEKSGNNIRILDLSMQRHRMRMWILAPAIASNTTLESLDLKNSGLVDEDVIALTDAICCSSDNNKIGGGGTIKDLDLSNNRRITDDGIIYLATKLPLMKTLRRLNILKTQLPTGSMSVMKALRIGMEDNANLMLLRCVFYRSVHHGRHVQYLVNLNRGGRGQALEGQSNINPTLWSLIFERANTTTYYCPLAQSAKEDTIYHLFRNSPSLWDYLKDE